MADIVTCRLCGCIFDKDEEGIECPSCGRMFIDSVEGAAVVTRVVYRPATKKEKKRFYKQHHSYAHEGKYLQSDYEEFTEPLDADELIAIQEESDREEIERFNEMYSSHESACDDIIPEMDNVGIVNSEGQIYSCKACHTTFEASERPSRCPYCGTKKIKHRRAVRLASKREREAFKNNSSLDSLPGNANYLRAVDYKNGIIYSPATPQMEKNCETCDYFAFCCSGMAITNAK